MAAFSYVFLESAFRFWSENKISSPAVYDFAASHTGTSACLWKVSGWYFGQCVMDFIIVIVKDSTGIWYLPTSSNSTADRWCCIGKERSCSPKQRLRSCSCFRVLAAWLSYNQIKIWCQYFSTCIGLTLTLSKNIIIQKALKSIISYTQFISSCTLIHVNQSRISLYWPISNLCFQIHSTNFEAEFKIAYKTSSPWRI